ncbi:MAG: flagellar filament capping protein FliD [Psychromonas sp.]|nr:flagellar filament capping protein FliD [Psychromonas sp.]
MPPITSTGLGTGLDINAIVTAIVGAEKDPIIAKVTKGSAHATAAISAYGLLNSDLSTFKSSYKDLGYNSTFAAAKASSTDSDILDAKLGIGAEIGNWEFEVKQRAQAQTLVSSPGNFTAVTDPVGEGVISLRFGSYSADGNTFNLNADKAIEKITIDGSNNSLEGLRNTINEGDFSVKASIINDGTNYRLVLTNKDTGEKNAVEITSTDTSGNAIPAGTGLDRLTYSATIKNIEETKSAQDAKIIMNGITITRDSNQIDSVIQGITLNINGETEIGKKVSLTISSDTSKVEEKIRAFVENYNITIKKMNDLTKFSGEGGTNGVLNGDSTIRNIQGVLRSVLNTPVNHIPGSIHSFADLGMLTQKDGTLELDITKFEKALKNDMAGIADFFTASGGSNDPFISFEGSNSLTKPGTYSVEVTQLATQSSLIGSSVASATPTVNADNDTFKMRLNGILTDDIVLSQGAYASISDLANELQVQINSDKNLMENDISIRVIEDAGKLSFTSSKYGSESTIAFTEVDSNFLSDFGIGVQSGTTGLDVEGLIDGKQASGYGQTLLSDNGDSTGIKLLIEGGLLGPREDITFSEGMSFAMSKVLSGIIDINISSSTGDINSSNSIIDGKLDSLYKGISALEETQKTAIYRADKLEARLYKEFNAMDIAVSSLHNTMEYLKGALDALPGYTRD